MSKPPTREVDDRVEDAAQATSGFSNPQTGACDAAKEADGEAGLDALFGSDCPELRKLFSIGC